MTRKVALFGMILIFVLVGCSGQPTVQPTPVVQTVVITQPVVITQLVPAPTLEPLSTQTPYPTYTPTPLIVVTATLTPTKVATITPTRKPAASVPTRMNTPTTNAGSGFCAAFAKCIGGTDMIKYLAWYYPGEIIDRARFGLYLGKSNDECQAPIIAEINDLRQTSACIYLLGEPADPDMKAMRAAALDGFGNLLKIRDVLLGTYLCRAGDSILLDTNRLNDAKMTYQGAYQCFTGVQAILDKYCK